MRASRPTLTAHPNGPAGCLGASGRHEAANLGHVPYARLRDAYQQQVEGLLAGDVDAILIETSQDLLQTKAATLGAKRALAYASRDLPVIVHVTVETTGTMLLGSEIGAALTSLEPLGIDMIGLNCATGPSEMSEHLRHLSRYATIGVSCMPNAGLPQLAAEGAVYPLQPVELADALEQFVDEFGLAWWAVAAALDLEHLRAGRQASGRPPNRRSLHRTMFLPRHRCTPTCSSARTSAICRSGNDQRQRVESLPRGAARGALGRLCRHCPIPDPRRRAPARPQHRLCRPRRRRPTCGRCIPAGDRLHPAHRAGLHGAGGAAGRAGILGGRAVINSANYEDGDGPGRFARIMPVAGAWRRVIALTIDEEGQARTAEGKVASPPGSSTP